MKKTVNRISESAGEDDGFTFVETLIVLAIMAVLSAGIGIPALSHIERAREISARTQIDAFRTALHTYNLDCAQFPTTDQGLAALWKLPELHPVPANWRGPYLDRPPRLDPWGSPWQYRSPGAENLPWTLSSYGADKKEGGEKDGADISSFD